MTQEEEEKSTGIAWAQSCLDGHAKNQSLTHESGHSAEVFLKKHGWKIVQTKFNGHGYKRKSTDHKSYDQSETRIYESADQRFQTTFCYYRFSTPRCLCGFKKISNGASSL